MFRDATAFNQDINDWDVSSGKYFVRTTRAQLRIPIQYEFNMKYACDLIEESSNE
jgi:hypothetical protein